MFHIVNAGKSSPKKKWTKAAVIRRIRRQIAVKEKVAEKRSRHLHAFAVKAMTQPKSAALLAILPRIIVLNC